MSGDCLAARAASQPAIGHPNVRRQPDVTMVRLKADTTYIQ
jgi:hypothetical protein